MSSAHDDREEEHDWPDDDLSHAAGKNSADAVEQPEPEDDAAHLPVRPPNRKSTTSRRRGSYRPPSELDPE